MILKNIRLKNYRKFKDTTIEFPDGVTGIIGLNGAGKSTIFEAISWVLYGPVAARTSSDQIKRDNTIQSDSCRVELEFIFENIEYRLFREITGKNHTSTATITSNGKIAATSAEAVSKYIRDKIGMDFKSFSTSIYAKQKELNALSTMISSERRPLILKMLDINSLDIVIKEIKSDKKEKNLIIDKLNQDIIDETGKDKIENLKNELKIIEKEKKNNEIVNIKLKERCIFFKNELNKLESSLNKNKKQYEENKNLKDKLYEKKILYEEKEKIRNEINIIKNKINDRDILIQDYKKKLSSYINVKENIKSSEQRVIDLNKNIEDSIKQIEKKNTLINRINNEINDIKTKKNKINKIGPNAICPTCERVLANQYKNLLFKFNNEIEKKEKEIKIFLKEISNYKLEKEKHSREQQAFQKKKTYYQNQLINKEKIETTISNIKNELKKEQSELENKIYKINKLSKIEFDVNNFKKISKLTDENYVIYHTSLKIRDKKKDEINKIKIELERKLSEIKLINQRIQNIKEKIKDIEKYKSRLKKEKNISNQLELLTDIMQNFRNHLISRIRPMLSDYSSDFFERLTNGKYNQIELDDNYNLLIYDNGKPFGIDRFSGGEEDLANLCLRLAISELITERAGGIFNFIILDEIFGSQDIYRRKNIMKALNVLSSKFRQIFLITHLDDLKNEMENIIYVKENEDGVSIAKVI